jgi:hypothetical protein
MRKICLGMAAIAFLTVGCAPLMPAPAEKIQTLPVVKMGDVTSLYTTRQYSHFA